MPPPEICVEVLSPIDRCPESLRDVKFTLSVSSGCADIGQRGNCSQKALNSFQEVGALEIVTGIVTLLLVLLLLPWAAVFAVLLVTALVTLLSGLYFRARLHGITGDCLGATNQLTEVALYLTAVILLRFSFLL